MKYVCIFCERSLEREFPDSDKEQFQPSNGGQVQLQFHYGSRFDWLGSRDPIHEPGFKEHVKTILTGGHSDWKPTTPNGLLGSKPSKECLKRESRAERLTACNRIMGIICDDCFEAKAHLFYGFEKSPDGDLKELVP